MRWPSAQLWENFTVGEACDARPSAQLWENSTVGEDLRSEALCAALGEFHCWRGLLGAMAGRRVVARRGKMARLLFFVNIYARIGDRRTLAVDDESSCLFFF